MLVTYSSRPIWFIYLPNCQYCKHFVCPLASQPARIFMRSFEKLNNWRLYARDTFSRDWRQFGTHYVFRHFDQRQVCLQRDTEMANQQTYTDRPVYIYVCWSTASNDGSLTLKISNLNYSHFEVGFRCVQSRIDLISCWLMCTRKIMPTDVAVVTSIGENCGWNLIWNTK